MNDVKFYLDPAEKKMGEATIYLEEALAHIRAGKANVKILDGVKVDAYGSKMALSAVANISVPDARSDHPMGQEHVPPHRKGHHGL